MSWVRAHPWVVFSGVLLGGLGSLLAALGNPANTGVCISCFLENAAGALALHGNPRMQYLRPELLGFVLGSAAVASASGEFRARWGAAGLASLGFGFLMALGSAVFIGCPIKALLRLAAGDLTSLPGIAGLAVGVGGGLALARAGDAGLEGPRRTAPLAVALGVVATAGLLAVLAFVPGTVAASRTGGGAIHAPPWLSLAAGLALGAACQRSRFCITGSLRDVLLTRTAAPAVALGGALGAAALVNAFTGQFRLGYIDQPGAHLDFLWGFLGMALVGLAAIFAGGCPFRQLVKAGEGDLDAAAVTVGMVVGAAVIQSWGLGASAGGVPAAGKVAVLLGLAAVLSLGLSRGKENP